MPLTEASLAPPAEAAGIPIPLPTPAAAAIVKGLPAQTEKDKDKEKSIPTTGLKILLVDDNALELMLARRSLEKQNCDVVSATNVTEALKQIAAQHFDVLLTDLHMPEPGDGFAVVTAMRHTQPEALT